MKACHAVIYYYKELWAAVQVASETQVLRIERIGRQMWCSDPGPGHCGSIVSRALENVILAEFQGGSTLNDLRSVVSVKFPLSSGASWSLKVQYKHSQVAEADNITVVTHSRFRVDQRRTPDSLWHFIGFSHIVKDGVLASSPILKAKSDIPNAQEW